MGTRLYVGNLPFNADEDQIRDLFGQGGRTVTEVTLVTELGERRLARAPKAEIAVGIVDEVERLLEERRGGK